MVSKPEMNATCKLVVSDVELNSTETVCPGRVVSGIVSVGKALTGRGVLSGGHDLISGDARVMAPLRVIGA